MSFQLPFDPKTVKHNSPEHFILKLGVVSASNIEKALAKKGSATRQTYMAELVAQVCTGEMPEINAKPLEWGNAHEADARAAYSLFTGYEVETEGFIMSTDFRKGCSPDVRIKGKRKRAEIKCPFSSKTYIEFLTCAAVQNEYEKQIQFSMWLTGDEEWDFVNYDPRMQKNMIHIKTYERDLKLMERFTKEIPEFIRDMDT